MKPTILAIAGRARAGKDTVANFLTTQDSRYYKVALADNLKNMCRVLFNLSPWHTDTQEGKIAKLEIPIVFDQAAFWKVVKYMDMTHTEQLSLIPDARFDYLLHKLPVTITTTRQLLQFVGTEICRALVESYHIDVLIHSITAQPTDNIWIVTDCRFADERAAFTKLPGINTKLILIKRPSADNVPATHASETSLGNETDYNHIILNNGTLNDLKYYVTVFNQQIKTAQTD